MADYEMKSVGDTHVREVSSPELFGNEQHQRQLDQDAKVLSKLGYKQQLNVCRTCYIEHKGKTNSG